MYIHHVVHFGVRHLQHREGGIQRLLPCVIAKWPLGSAVVSDGTLFL